VLGVVDGFTMADGSYMTADGKMVERKKTVICLPDTVTRKQMVAIVRDTMSATFAAFPSDKDLAATGTVIAAFRHKFPCQGRLK
jgi:Rap1a immunity proteins